MYYSYTRDDRHHLINIYGSKTTVVAQHSSSVRVCQKHRKNNKALRKQNTTRHLKAAQKPRGSMISFTERLTGSGRMLRLRVVFCGPRWSWVLHTPVARINREKNEILPVRTCPQAAAEILERVWFIFHLAMSAICLLVPLTSHVQAVNKVS